MNSSDDIRWFLFKNIFDDFFLIKYRKSGDYWIDTDDEIQVEGLLRSKFKMKCIINGIDRYWVSDENKFQFMHDVFKCEDVDQHFYSKEIISNEKQERIA